MLFSLCSSLLLFAFDADRDRAYERAAERWLTFVNSSISTAFNVTYTQITVTTLKVLWNTYELFAKYSCNDPKINASKYFLSCFY